MPVLLWKNVTQWKEYSTATWMKRCGLT
uniref:Uncharacterized protein n=1 Tax=Anguilla anguilla TaxID=7936 RepID=A0A0E9W419_ANGAN